MTTAHFEGSCLCGEVAYVVEGEVRGFYHCHCERCRKVTGTGHASNILVAADTVDWTRGEQQVQRYDVPGAKRFASVFCGRCGSYLPRVSPGFGLVAVPAGSLDHDPGIRPDARIFCASRTAWSCEDALPGFDEYPG